jgi:hypothetical protein
MDDSTIFGVLETILKDDSFGNKSENKLRAYAAQNPDLVKHHPMLLIYCCASNGNVDECIRLIATLSDFSNFKTSRASSDEIYSLIQFVVTESNKSKPILMVILESEKSNLKVIKSVPVLFFKACVDRENFDLQQLQKMLFVRGQVQSNDLSQHDASVNVGTLLVDKYVKPKLNDSLVE